MSQIPRASQHCLSRGEAKGLWEQGSPNGLQWFGVPSSGLASHSG